MSMSETGWTPELVAERLEEAVDVLARLPEERVRGLYDLWPRMIGARCAGAQAAAPVPEAIDRMDEALVWLAWLQRDERYIVWFAGGRRAVEAHHAPAWHGPDDRLGAFQQSIAQDLGPAERHG